MFQVTIYNHATGAVNNQQFKLLADAQANLEQQVAGFRSAVNGTNRVFFTASILDTKSGKYYGFVSDAPPAITLTV